MPDSVDPDRSRRRRLDVFEVLDLQSLAGFPVDATRLEREAWFLRNENAELHRLLARATQENDSLRRLLDFTTYPGWLRRKLRPRLGHLRHSLPHRVAIPAHYAKTLPPADAPRLSIVTPVLNQATFIRQTIDSIIGQGYPRLEYFVRDGGSWDGTTDIVRSRRDALTGWTSEGDGGQAEAINNGFAGTTGEIMAWLNGDDILLPGTLNYVGRFFEQNPDVDLVYGHRVLIDDDGKEIGRWVLPKHDDEVLRWADFVPQETLFWRRRVWERVGPLDTSFKFAMDWDFLLRALEAGFKFHRLPRFLGAFRVHPRQKTSAQEAVGAAECTRLRQRTFGHDPDGRAIRHALRSYMVRHVFLHRLFRLRLLRY